ncbi:alpha/beta fold hydrolase [Streptomyces mirabilis]|uniref:alpha/beta fold hydrolase n=1 Tax=Streptomyces mirabilis TaxID=68239 RepID=UPI003449F120
MRYVHTNGIRLAYPPSGQGENVLLVMGSSAAGRVWTVYQTPALNQVEYETITFDNRGIAPSDAPGKYSLADMVADTKGSIEELDLAPCGVVGTFLSALITQKLAVHHPRLVRCAVLLAPQTRSDVARRALLTSGIELPPTYGATKTAFQMLAWFDTDEDRLEAPQKNLRSVQGHRLLRWPHHTAALGRRGIKNCDFVEIPGTGRLGYLKHPEIVNPAIIGFLDKH